MSSSSLNKIVGCSGKLRNIFKENNCLGGISQIIILYIIIIFCLVQLHLETIKNREIVISLLSSSIGYLLPNPKTKNKKINNVPEQYINSNTE